MVKGRRVNAFLTFWVVPVIMLFFSLYPTTFSAHAGETLHFSDWEFELPADPAISERSTDRLVLKSIPGQGEVTDVVLKSTSTVKARIGGAGVNYSETRSMSLMPAPS